MVQFKQPVNPSTSAVDTTATLCTVQSIDLTNKIASVIDQSGAHRPVSLKYLPGKPTSYPAVGETWVISREYGDWMFVVGMNVAPETLSSLSAGPTMTASFTALPNTHYIINLPNSLGAVPVTLPTSPAQGTVVAFSRIDSFALASFCNITPGGTDTMNAGSPYVLSANPGAVSFIYNGSTWYTLYNSFKKFSGLFGPSSSNDFGTNLMSRNASGQTEVGTPTTGNHAVNKTYADALGVSAATASTIVRRDASGRAQVVDPAVAADIATKNYVDATAGTSLGTASTLMRRDASGRAQVVDPSAAQDIATKHFVNQYGLGAQMSASQIAAPGWNQTLNTGFFEGLDSGGNLNGPPDLLNTWQIGYVVQHDPHWCTQYAWSLTDPTAATRRYRRRGFDTGGAQGWDVWVPDVPAQQYSYFEEWKLSAQVITTGTITTLTGLTSLTNINNLGVTPMNLSTGVWTCPVSGVYTLTLYAGSSAASARTEALITNNTTATRLGASDAVSQNFLTVSTTRWVPQSNVVVFQYFQSSGASGTIATTAPAVSVASVLLH